MERIMGNARLPEGLLEAAKMSVLLGLDEIDPVFIMDAFDKLRTRHRDGHQKIAATKDLLDEKLKELGKLEETTAKLKQSREALMTDREIRHEQLESMKRSTITLKIKHEEYTKRSGQLEQILHSISNGKPFPKMHDITQLLVERKMLQAEQLRLSRELEIFNRLPEDWTLAQIEVAQAEKRLESLLYHRDQLLHQKEYK
jgi:hypothetical protein